MPHHSSVDGQAAEQQFEQKFWSLLAMVDFIKFLDGREVPHGEMYDAGDGYVGVSYKMYKASDIAATMSMVVRLGS